jgi:hypothetical protein
MPTKGIVYVLSNPAMPDIVKIGKTTDLAARIKSLSRSSGVPLAFTCVCAKEVDDMDFVEQKLHKAYKHERVNENREFFRIPEEALIEVFDLISGNYVDLSNDIFESKEDQVAFEKATRIGDRFNFSSVGINLGAILNFSKDEKITCEVVSNTVVNFRGERHSLSSAGVIAINECGYKWISIAGPKHWKFKGETLFDRRKTLLDGDE